MGAQFSQTFADKQREVQAEMMQKQTENMLRTQERMRRMMVAQQLAVARERFYWIGGTYATALTAFSAFVVKNKRVPPAAAIPLFIGTVVTAHQADLAYGTKLERINKMTGDLLTQNQGEHWFVPLMPSEQDAEKLKKL
eukprot:TRINITY_DN15747_c0_g1_i1.p1 TRINITY_DN15747_c0_g1~~TRINITY_DN15747_c0_g1_i1.p1  ORF type:complete len:158 (-),score=24.13 TRINITY_DN15747_c0_g1_i1:42-458(-)